MSKMRKIVVAAAVIAVSLSALIGATRNSDIYFLIKKNFTIFSEVYREVSLNYVDEVNPEKLMRKGLNSMLESLDPYTVFIDESQNQDIEIITRGSYAGVGLDVGMRGDKIVVIAPMDGYPAQQKGIRAGDIIKQVNDVDVASLTPEEVQNLTMGEPGTSLTLTIERYGIEEDLVFELKRERIEVKNIAHSDLIGPEKDIGYISLSRFSQNTADEIRKAIENFQKEGSLNGLVLDLRNNPGGLLDEAVKTVDKFVDPGLKVVETRGRLSQHNSTFRTEEPALLRSTPLVVLQNEGSASASEIVAGALQDLDRAVIVGEQSFGKGLVQIVQPLSYNTALKITTSRYFIPSGRSIQSITYTHDDKNSAVIKPDSLRNSFKTRNGRTVYDGEGIAPDVEVKSTVPSLLETELMKESHFFFFANQMASERDTFDADAISDEMFAAFRSYLENKNFSYETESERYLTGVEKRLGEQVASTDVKAHIDAIDQAIEKKKKQDFENQNSELKRALYLEVISRFEG
ncbi:MAG TPA: S41 family peptidase, partial [Halalkalibaculum sp.]|nr:S41 family peptidase [Halalkalibaculum sp.]